MASSLGGTSWSESPPGGCRLPPKYMGFKRDLDRYLEFYNRERAHNGRRTRGRTPWEVLNDRAMWLPE